MSKNLIIRCCAGLVTITLASCVATKSASEMRKIQEEEGMFSGDWLHESIYYAGSTKKFHYLWQRDFRPWGLNDDWRVFRVLRSELTLEAGLEKPYNSSAKHDEETMRYAAITTGPTYKLEKRLTIDEKSDLYAREIRSGERKIRMKTEILPDCGQRTKIWSEKTTPKPPATPTSSLLPIPPLPQGTENARIADHEMKLH